MFVRWFFLLLVKLIIVLLIIERVNLVGMGLLVVLVVFIDKVICLWGI